LIAILALAAMITAFLIASALNRSSADVSNEREDRSMSALRQAKAALIAYAASEQWQNTGGATPFQPGALPCPDRDNDGIAEDHEPPPPLGSGQQPCSTALKRIGRFPWITVGAEDLRDASGERLWYAVSSTFLKNTPAYTNVINSDTQGLLTVNGTAAANNVVAVLFAPGEAFRGQVRDPTSAITYNDPVNFLEQFDATTYATFSSNASPSQALNDRVLVLTRAELMSTVEPIVAANIERDIKPYVQAYVTDWGAYPFPAAFGNPGRPMSQYVGDTSVSPPRGLLPVSRAALQWKTSSLTVTQVAGGMGAYAGSPPASTITWNCGASTTTQISCQINYPGGGNDRPAIKLQAVLQGAALSFPTGLKIDNPVMTNINGDLLSYNGATYAQWSPVPPPYPPVQPPTVDNTAQSDGTGLVTFYGVLQNAAPPWSGTGGLVTIKINLPAYQPITDSTDPNAGWFAANEWYRQTWYAVSQGVLPGAGGTCSTSTTPPPLCLTVNNLRPSYVNWNDKRAILVLAGSSLNGNLRPSTNLPDYFENANLVAANGAALIYENRSGVPTTINDRVVVISP
jgi:hypothetical protein